MTSRRSLRCVLCRRAIATKHIHFRLRDGSAACARCVERNDQYDQIEGVADRTGKGRA